MSLLVDLPKDLKVYLLKDHCDTNSMLACLCTCRAFGMAQFASQLRVSAYRKRRQAEDICVSRRSRRPRRNDRLCPYCESKHLNCQTYASRQSSNGNDFSQCPLLPSVCKWRYCNYTGVRVAVKHHQISCSNVCLFCGHRVSGKKWSNHIARKCRKIGKSD